MIDRDEAIRVALAMCVKTAGRGLSQVDTADIVDAMEEIPVIAFVLELWRDK